MNYVKCRNNCGMDVVYSDQHLMATPDGDAWLCREPTMDQLLGRDKPRPLDNRTRQAIEADKLISGRGFARLREDGTVEHIPASQMLIFDGDVDPKNLGEEFKTFWDAFNKHTNPVSSGPTSPPPSQQLIVDATRVRIVTEEAHTIVEELAAILRMPDDQVHTFDDVKAAVKALMDPVAAMYLTCPKCNARHIDEGAFVHKPHHTHSCQSCGLTWRPAIGYTVGVQFLPGFKNP